LCLTPIFFNMLELTIAIIGAGGIIAQTVLLRELLVAFMGNELTLGLILGSWMLGEAAGALVVGRIAGYIKEKEALLITLLAVFSVALLACTAGVRMFRPLLGIALGQGIGTGVILISSFLLLLPVSFCHGGMFSLCCSLASVTKTYVLETLGTLAGGIALTWWLIPEFSHFGILCVTAFISVAACTVYLRSLTRISAKIILYPIVLACLFFFLMVKPASIEQYTLSRQYRQGKVLDYRNSLYGNVVVTQKEGQRVFFYNGVPDVTTPVPDVTFAREFGHLPLLFCDNPKDIMVINAGLGGLVTEILKEPVSRIDYCQQDSSMVRMLWKYPSKLTSMELNDTRLNVIHQDPRVVLRDARHTYDAIYIGSQMPGDLASNRFFTEEFFSLVRSRLKPAGVFAFCLPGSLTYISPLLRDMNYMIINGLTRNFGRVRIIPGDYNIILASDGAEFNLNPSALYSRFRKRGIRVSLLNPGYLKLRLDSQWIDWFRQSTTGATRMINRDDKPVAVYQVLISWNKQFSGTTMALLQAFSRIRLWMVLAAIAAWALAAAALMALRPRRAPKAALLYSISTTGFFGMAMNLALIYSFQMHYGFIYQMIGALTALFMAGAAAGSIIMRFAAPRFKKGFTAFFANEAAAVIFIVICIFLIPRIQYGVIFTPLYLALFFISGILLGAEFPLAVRLYGGSRERDSRATGVVFCADLVGGVVAAIGAGVILLPLLGIGGMLIALAVLKGSAALNIYLIKNTK